MKNENQVVSVNAERQSRLKKLTKTEKVIGLFVICGGAVFSLSGFVEVFSVWFGG